MNCIKCDKSILHRHPRITLTLGILIIIFVALFVLIIPLIENGNVVTNTYLITDKEFVSRSNYLIFTKDLSGKPYVFENTDAYFRGKYDSDEFNAIMEVGQLYNLTTVGYEIPIISKYPNIIGVEPPGD